MGESNDLADNIAIISPDTTTFTSFPRLPNELRRKIWRLCLPFGARTIELGNSKAGEVFTTTQLCTTFHVNRESRAESIFSMKYERLTLSINRARNSAQTLCDYSRDTLYLNSALCSSMTGYDEQPTAALSTLAAALGTDQARWIERLAIECYQWGDFDEPKQLAAQLLRFQGLKTLIIVMMVDRPRIGHPYFLGDDTFRFEEPEWDYRKEERNLQGRFEDLYTPLARRVLEWHPPQVLIVCLKKIADCKRREASEY